MNLCFNYVSIEADVGWSIVLYLMGKKKEETEKRNVMK